MIPFDWKALYYGVLCLPVLLQAGREKLYITATFNK